MQSTHPTHKRRESKMQQKLMMKKTKGNKVFWRECKINFHTKSIDQDDLKEKNHIDMTKCSFSEEVQIKNVKNPKTERAPKNNDDTVYFVNIKSSDREQELHGTKAEMDTLVFTLEAQGMIKRKVINIDDEINPEDQDEDSAKMETTDDANNPDLDDSGYITTPDRCRSPNDQNISDLDGEENTENVMLSYQKTTESQQPDLTSTTSSQGPDIIADRTNENNTFVPSFGPQKEYPIREGVGRYLPLESGQEHQILVDGSEAQTNKESAGFVGSMKMCYSKMCCAENKTNTLNEENLNKLNN